MRPIIQALAVAVIVVLASASGVSAHDKTIITAPFVDKATALAQPYVMDCDLENIEKLVNEKTCTLRQQNRDLKKDFDGLKERTDIKLDAHRERINDLHSKADWFAILTTAFAILIALAAGASFVAAVKISVRNAKQWIMEDATKEVDELSAKLVAQSEEGVAQKIDKLKQSFLEQIESMIADASDGFDARLEEARKHNRDTRDLLERAQGSIGKNKKGDISENDKRELAKEAAKLENKPERDRTFNDWDIKAFSYYHSGNVLKAAETWLQAAAIRDIPDEDIAFSLVSAGTAYGEIEQLQDATNIFDEVEQRFGLSDTPTVQTMVAESWNGRGFIVFLKAKQKVLAGDKLEDQSDLIHQGLDHIHKALDIVPNDGDYLDSKAYGLFLLNEGEGARGSLFKALKKGGENLYKASFRNTDNFTILKDGEWKYVVEEVWAEVQAEKAKDTSDSKDE